MKIFRFITLKFFILLCASFISFFSAQSYPQLISTIKVFKNKIAIQPCETLREEFFNTDTLTFEYDPDVDIRSLDDSIITIPFIALAAPAVWVSGKTFSVESIDNDLYESLKKIKEVFKLFYPTVSWDGDIVADRIIENLPSTWAKKDEMAVLFSGGVDSTATSIGRFYRKQLLITNHGIDKKFVHTKAWENVKAQCEEFATLYGHSTTFVKFNYRAAFKESAIIKYFNNPHWSWFKHVAHGLYLMCPSAPLLFLKGYNKLYIASSSADDDPYPWGSHPLLDNNLKFCGISVCHDQPDLTRPQKINLIEYITQKNKFPRPKLRICWRDEKGYNCGTCEKCLRTAHAILSQGLYPRQYGVSISLSSLKERTHELLSHRTFDHTVLWEWQMAQNEARKNLKNKSFIEKQSKEFIAYLQWFASLNILKYCNKDAVCLPEEEKKPFFTDLWEQGSKLNTDPFIHPEGWTK